MAMINLLGNVTTSTDKSLDWVKTFVVEFIDNLGPKRLIVPYILVQFYVSY